MRIRIATILLLVLIYAAVLLLAAVAGRTLGG